MSLSKSKYWYSNNCLHFLKRAVPLKYLQLETPPACQKNFTKLVSLAHRYLQNIDCLSFIVCPLLAPLLPRYFPFFCSH